MYVHNDWKLIYQAINTNSFTYECYNIVAAINTCKNVKCSRNQHTISNRIKYCYDKRNACHFNTDPLIVDHWPFMWGIQGQWIILTSGH